MRCAGRTASRFVEGGGAHRGRQSVRGTQRRDQFGPAELIDSIAIRPLAYYIGPLIFGNVVAGWIFGKLLSDIGFYVLAIFSYERFNGLLAGRRPSIEEADGGAVPAVEAE